MIFGARGGGPVRGEDGESRGDTSEVKAPIPAAGAVGPVKSPRRPRSLLGWLVAAVTWAVVASVVAAILFAGRGAPPPLGGDGGVPGGEPGQPAGPASVGGLRHIRKRSTGVRDDPGVHPAPRLPARVGPNGQSVRRRGCRGVLLYRPRMNRAAASPRAVPVPPSSRF